MSTSREEYFALMKQEVGGATTSPQRIDELPRFADFPSLWSLGYDDLPPLNDMPKLDGSDPFGWTGFVAPSGFSAVTDEINRNWITETGDYWMVEAG